MSKAQIESNEDLKGNCWKCWKAKKKQKNDKWMFLQHNGPLFPPAYDMLPDNVNFYYDGQKVVLNEEAEEIATFFTKCQGITKQKPFKENFFNFFRRAMTPEEKKLIQDVDKCDFSEITKFLKFKSCTRNPKDINAKKFGTAILDGQVQKIGHYKVDPPGLFLGRGNNSKSGMLKKRVQPEDVIINCGKDSIFPKPPEGHNWKKIIHNPQVAYLWKWPDNLKSTKYGNLDSSSKLKVASEIKKFDLARMLKRKIGTRMDCSEDLKSKSMLVRQCAVALSLIDLLALRAGNDKNNGQTDTVGCCTLRVEHITLHNILHGKRFVVELDFLGKDSIPYHNFVPVDSEIFHSLGLFMIGKNPD